MKIISRRSKKTNKVKKTGEQSSGKKIMYIFSLLFILLFISELYKEYKIRSLNISKYLYKFDKNAMILNAAGSLNVTKYVLKKLDKEIILFGDFHINHPGVCTNISNALPPYKIIDLIIKYNPAVTIDFFFEQMLIRQQDLKTKFFGATEYISWSPYQTDLTDIFFYFRSCFFSNCKKYWNNLRIHSIDIRKQKMYISIMKLLSGLSVPSKELIDELYPIVSDTKKMREIFKIDKQLNKITDKNMREHLEKYAKKIIDENLKKINEIKTNVSECINYIFVRFLIYMDIYNLGRIFRSFDNYNSKYIIIFAGGLHILNYIKFIDIIKDQNDIKIEAGKYLPDEVRLPNIDEVDKFIDHNYCTDISKMNLPLLETAPPLTKQFDDQRKKAMSENNFTLLEKFYLQYSND